MPHSRSQASHSEWAFAQGEPVDYISKDSSLKTRVKFVRKVYLILIVQVLFTFGCVGISMHSGFSEYIKTLGWRCTDLIFGVAALNFLITPMVFSSFPGFLRKNPWKWIVLTVFTVFCRPLPASDPHLHGGLATLVLSQKHA